MNIENFNPNGVGIKNGNFIGLPFNKLNAQIVLYPVPWDVTVSYRAGTSTGPQNILEASSQLDLYDADYPDSWKRGIFFHKIDEELAAINTDMRSLADGHIESLEAGESGTEFALNLVNDACVKMVDQVFHATQKLMDEGKIVGLIGGDHSTPLGYLRALSENHTNFGILHIDAHMDMRKAYEEFEYSHASIMYNVMTSIPNISKIIQVGIRDYCDEEVEFAKALGNRAEIYFEQNIQRKLLTGVSYHEIATEIILNLPNKVYISFDVDGLDPKLCPNTGTPVPGGLEFAQAIYLMKLVKDSGREIIGFDVVETGGFPNDWDGNVAARIVYKLCGMVG